MQETRSWESDNPGSKPSPLTRMTLSNSLPLSALQLSHWQIGDSKAQLTGLMMDEEVICKLSSAVYTAKPGVYATC